MINTEPEYNEQEFESIVTNLYQQSLIFEVSKSEATKKELIPPVELLKAVELEYDTNPEGVIEKFKKIQIWFFNNKFAEIKTLKNKIESSSLYTSNSSFQKEQYALGPICTLQSMIEKTYMKDKEKMDLMLDQYCKLEDDIFKFRSISGDGNCYYRSVNSAYLENMVFTQNILALKQLVIEIFYLFESSNPFLNELSKEVAGPYKLINREQVISLLLILISFLENNNDTETGRIRRSYEFLIKCFNYSKHFDIVTC